jgi:hypothetical protein
LRNCPWGQGDRLTTNSSWSECFVLCRATQRATMANRIDYGLLCPGYHSGKKGLQYGTRTGTGRLEREIKETKEFPLHRKLSLASPRESYPGVSRFSGDDLGIDMEKFAHFALGVVGRAAIHDWTMPDGMILPSQAIGDFERPIRNYLLGGNFPPDTSVIVIVCSDDQSRRIWYTSMILIEANYLNFRFLARGVFFRVIRCLRHSAICHAIHLANVFSTEGQRTVCPKLWLSSKLLKGNGRLLACELPSVPISRPVSRNPSSRISAGDFRPMHSSRLKRLFVQL